MKVFAQKNLPVKLPINSTVIMILILKETDARGWIIGAVGVLYLILWIFSIIAIVKQEEIDYFKNEKDDEKTN